MLFSKCQQKRIIYLNIKTVAYDYCDINLIYQEKKGSIISTTVSTENGGHHFLSRVSCVSTNRALLFTLLCDWPALTAVCPLEGAVHHPPEPLQEQSHAGLSRGQTQLQSAALPAQLLQLFPKTLSWKHTHTHTHTYMHAYTHTRIHIHTYIHTHTHTQTIMST